MVSRMFELMYEHNGVGLAANQVDLPIRLFVMNPSGKKGEGEETVMINPVISKSRGSEDSEEGCLSIPGIHANITRSKSIYVTAYDLDGNEISREFTGFEARIIQHETDHLDGILFIDRLSDTSQKEIAYELNNFVIDFESRQRTGSIPPQEKLLSQLADFEKRYC